MENALPSPVLWERIYSLAQGDSTTSETKIKVAENLYSPPKRRVLIAKKLTEYKSLLFQNSDGKVVNKTILAADLARLGVRVRFYKGLQISLMIKVPKLQSSS